MFLDNKYTKTYNAIINRARIRCTPEVVEHHHIIPESLGGTEVVKLTPREHFICHRLLVKMLTGDAQKKMILALHLMVHLVAKYAPTSLAYTVARQQFIQSIKGKRMLMSEASTKRIADANRRRIGWKHTDSAKNKIAMKANGRKPKSCTIGDRIYPSVKALIADLGQGRGGIKHPNFQYCEETK